MTHSYVTWSHTATYCNTLQHTATHSRRRSDCTEHSYDSFICDMVTHCNTLQHTLMTHSYVTYRFSHLRHLIHSPFLLLLQHFLQHVALFRSMLQRCTGRKAFRPEAHCTAIHTALQHTRHCNTHCLLSTPRNVATIPPQELLRRILLISSSGEFSSGAPEGEVSSGAPDEAPPQELPRICSAVYVAVIREDPHDHEYPPEELKRIVWSSCQSCWIL